MPPSINFNNHERDQSPLMVGRKTDAKEMVPRSLVLGVPSSREDAIEKLNMFYSCTRAQEYLVPGRKG